jgi:hypothetical protein
MSDDEDDPKFNARNTDPHTSHDAAETIRSKAKDEAVVWATYVKAQRPLATFQLEEILGGHNDGKWRKRRSDLVRKGFLVDTGVRIRAPKSKKEQILWTINRDPLPVPLQGRLDL